MIVVVDIGNSRIKWARFESGRICPSSSTTHRDRLEEALAEFAQSLPADTRRVLVANVAGKETATRLHAAIGHGRGVSVEFVATPAEQFGVRCGYEKVERLGVDRWVAIVEAWNQERESGGEAPVAVVDAGTTVTFDAADASGTHLGGLILAGAQLSSRALALNTSDIGATPTQAHVPQGLDMLGRTTAAAVANAARLGAAAAVDRAIAIVEEALGGKLRVFLTGGDGPILDAWLANDTELRADLVLEGLARIARSGGDS